MAFMLYKQQLGKRMVCCSKIPLLFKSNSRKKGKDNTVTLIPVIPTINQKPVFIIHILSGCPWLSEQCFCCFYPTI